MEQAIARASGPARRTTPIPPRPGGVAMATMVSSRFMFLKSRVEAREPYRYDSQWIALAQAARNREHSDSLAIAIPHPLHLRFEKSSVIVSRFGIQKSQLLIAAFPLQPGKMVFNPLIDVVNLAMEMCHLQLGFQVHFIIQVGFQ